MKKTTWMNKKKTALLLLTVLLIAAAVFFRNRNQVVYGISQGIYVMQTEQENVPEICFDLTEQPSHFVAVGDRRMSFAYRGTVEVKKGYAWLHVENSGQTWVFEVIDNDTLAFVESESDECKLAKDGDIFLYKGEWY